MSNFIPSCKANLARVNKVWADDTRSKRQGSFNTTMAARVFLLTFLLVVILHHSQVFPVIFFNYLLVFFLVITSRQSYFVVCLLVAYDQACKMCFDFDKTMCNVASKKALIRGLKVRDRFVIESYCKIEPWLYGCIWVAIFSVYNNKHIVLFVGWIMLF